MEGLSIRENRRKTIEEAIPKFKTTAIGAMMETIDTCSLEQVRAMNEMANHIPLFTEELNAFNAKRDKEIREELLCASNCF